jgi:hypothetical protein
MAAPADEILPSDRASGLRHLAHAPGELPLQYLEGPRKFYAGKVSSLSYGTEHLTATGTRHSSYL